MLIRLKQLTADLMAKKKKVDNFLERQKRHERVAILRRKKIFLVSSSVARIGPAARFRTMKLAWKKAAIKWLIWTMPKRNFKLPTLPCNHCNSASTHWSKSAVSSRRSFKTRCVCKNTYLCYSKLTMFRNGQSGTWKGSEATS